jgi:outer membrane protein OmpA-like peptidoglycan-associated protein
MARDAIIRAFGMTRPAGVVAVVALLLAAAVANAQEGGTATGSAGDSVTVDLSVLESLGPAPADASRAGGTVRLIPPAGTPSRPAPPPLTAAPPPPPAELTGGTAPPPPVTGATPAPTESPAESPAETVRREEPKAVPPPSAVEPPAPPSEPPAATAGKKAPETPPPPAVAAPQPPPQEPPAATARKEAPETAPPPAQSAALPKAPKAAPRFGAGATRAIAYAAGDTKLPDDAQAVLRAAVAALKTDPALRIQLNAYAASSKEGESRARRLSLSRALGVRSFLIKQGVEPTRIDVRALGSNVPDGSPDRVDVSLVAR